MLSKYALDLESTFGKISVHQTPKKSILACVDFKILPLFGNTDGN